MTEIPFTMTDHPDYLHTAYRTWVPGDHFDINWTGITKDIACGSYQFAIRLRGEPGDVDLGQHHHDVLGAGANSIPISTTLSSIKFDVITDGYCSTGVMHNVVVLGATIDTLVPGAP